MAEDISGSVRMRGIWFRVCGVVQGGLDLRSACTRLSPRRGNCEMCTMRCMMMDGQ